ncbi:MAG: hypothetical protein RIS75_1132 [Actinomycetota bacterium]|jgi:hypothetical protein
MTIDRNKSPRGSAVGLGSMPGTSAHESLGIITDTVTDLVHVPELPARGPGGEMVGRTVGLLHRVDDGFSIETTPSGWRIARGENRIMRRANSWLNEDIDELEAVAHEHSGFLKMQIAGPWTLAASIEMINGHRIINDFGAVQDYAQGISAAVSLFLKDARRRFPHASWVIQIDEPWIGGVLRGEVPTRTGRGSLPPVDGQTVQQLLTNISESIHTQDAVAWIHTCANQPPLELMVKAGFDGISVDMSQLRNGDEEFITDMWDKNVVLIAGLDTAHKGSQSNAARALLDPVVDLARKVSAPLDSLKNYLNISPTCGLAFSADPARELNTLVSAADILRELEEGSH